MVRGRVPGAVVAAVLATALVGPAAFGQPAAPSPAPTPPPPAASTAAPPGTPLVPAEAGRLRWTHGGWRASRIVGAVVYNDSGQRIGTIDDLLVGQDGRISVAVLSVGGFLGIGAKLVGVPYSQLRFEEHTEERTVAAPRPATGDAAQVPPGAPIIQSPAPTRPVVLLTQVVLPGATRDSLNALPAFSYRD